MREVNQIDAPVDLQRLSIADFEPFRQQPFIIEFSAQQSEEALLTDVLPLAGYTTLERKPFSIVLQTAQKTKYYPQAIYTVVHPVLGAIALFLVPLGVKEGGVQYEAVFS